MEEEYFEDVELNKVHRTRYFDITEEAIIAFAKEWNPEPFHIDKEVAAKHQIGRIFACGPHLISICVKLNNERRPRPASVAGLGWNDLTFSTPVFDGDRLYAESYAIEKRLSKSNPSVGLVKYDVKLRNQNDKAVLTYNVTTMIECKK